MRISCNGCRVLRKGCSENCSIRPCLQWIKSPDSQANATVFLAKFYGRAGLINLINSGPDHLRPAIFRSLLYEACGRIVNPIYGSVGLLWSGQWEHCQNAVDAVLKGAPITPIATEATAGAPPFKGCDIRHVTKEEKSNSDSYSKSPELHRVKSTRTRFKRSNPKPTKGKAAAAAAVAVAVAVSELVRSEASELNGSSTSHDSTVSHPDEATVDTSSMMAVERADVEERADDGGDGDNNGELKLELTLGFGHLPVQVNRSSEPKSCSGSRASDGGGFEMNLGLV